jgi:exosortase
MDGSSRQWAWVGGLALVFAPAAIALAGVWSSLDYYSHGFFVPLVAFWIALPRIRGLGPTGCHGGALAWLGITLGVYALGLLLGNPTLLGLALVGAVAGLVLRFWGREGLRALTLPLAFLLFAVPIPQAVLGPVIQTLQLWVSRAGVEILHGAGFAVLREGNVVLLADGQSLFVDEACSGITSIVTLLPLGVVLAWYTLRGGWARGLLVLAVVPIAMLGNLVRVLATVGAAHRFGVAQVTAGPLHDSAGLLTFVFACALLIGLGGVLRSVLPGERGESQLGSAA